VFSILRNPDGFVRKTPSPSVKECKLLLNSSVVATGSVPVKRNVSPRRIGFSKTAFNADNLNIALLMARAGALNSNWFRGSWTAVPVLFW